MQNDFYSRLFQAQGMELIVPPLSDQETVHGIIFPELEAGIVVPEKKDRLLSLCKAIIRRHNLDGIILGCTELPLMLNNSDFDVDVLDTAGIHIDCIVDRLVGER